MIQNLNKILAARMQADPKFLNESSSQEESTISLDEMSKTLDLMYQYIKKTEEKRNLDIIEIKKTQLNILRILEESREKSKD